MTLTSEGVNYIFEALGTIKANLTGVREQLDVQARAAREEGEDTADKLGALTTQVGRLGMQITMLESSYAGLRASMNVLEPKVETLVTQRNRVVSIATAVIAAATAAWWMFGGAITELAKGVWHGFKV